MIMIQEEKQLLLQDLCARLPYGVRGRVYAECSNGKYDMNGDMIFFDSPFDVTLDSINISTEELHVVTIGNDDTIDFIENQQTWGEPYTVDEFKPYLRPMSSMTEKECAELRWLNDQCDAMSTFEYITVENYRIYDWLNRHHFDYRNLIEKNLALDCTGLHIYD